MKLEVKNQPNVAELLKKIPKEQKLFIVQHLLLRFIAGPVDLQKFLESPELVVSLNRLIH